MTWQIASVFASVFGIPCLTLLGIALARLRANVHYTRGFDDGIAYEKHVRAELDQLYASTITGSSRWGRS